MSGFVIEYLTPAWAAKFITSVILYFLNKSEIFFLFDKSILKKMKFFLLIFLITFVVGFKFLINKNYNIKKAWHQTLLKMPVFGNLINKSILAKVSLVLGNLNQAGVDLIESIDIAKSVTDNVVVIESLENIKKG